MTEIKFPVLDAEVLQQKTNEAAMKGAIAVINDYYNSYGSPYKKAIEDALKEKKFHHALELPDILAIINESLSKEIDLIANAAIAKTYIPMVHEFITRVEKEMFFSDVLKKFIEFSDVEHEEDCSIDVEKHERWDWLSVKIRHEKETWDFTLHTVYVPDSEKGENYKPKYQILGLPNKNDYDNKTYNRTMKMSIDGVSLEMPFTKDILSDKFCSHIAKMVLSNTHIILDVQDFDSDMFPERCHCN